MAKQELYSTEPEPARAFLVGVILRTSEWPVDRSLDELARLAETDGAEVVGRTTQRLDKPVPRSYIGSGKVEEIGSLITQLSIDVVIFDDEISPSQQMYLQNTWGTSNANIQVMDRTALILDIFGLHAQTREGRLQVELAQLQYQLPRLRGMWSNLEGEKTRGGIGGMMGAGESQLEADRRTIRARITKVKEELAQVERQRDVQSKERSESSAFRVALAGYTNSGKSTLLNHLTDANVYAEDKLFGTLDPTTRAFDLPGGRVVTLTDTVGFIQKLPHELVDAFKSTLAEVREADLILKVVDAADEDRERHIETVDAVLDEIGAGEVPALMVYNKIDLLSEEDRKDLRLREPDAVCISALDGMGVEELVARIAKEAAANDRLLSACIPYKEGALLSAVHEQGHVISEEYDGEGAHIVAKVPARLASRLERYVEE